MYTYKNWKPYNKTPHFNTYRLGYNAVKLRLPDFLPWSKFKMELLENNHEIVKATMV